jgi:hypothetical protein
MLKDAINRSAETQIPEVSLEKTQDDPPDISLTTRKGAVVVYQQGTTSYPP